MSANMNNTHETTDDIEGRRAFQQGVILALVIAFVPIAVLSTGLFLSGYQPADFDTNLRYAMLGLWLVFLFSVDRLANLKVWLSVPFIKAEQSGEYLTIFAFSALLAALKLSSDMGAWQMIGTWLQSFTLLMLLFLLLHAVFSMVRGSWRRSKARKAARRDAHKDATAARKRA